MKKAEFLWLFLFFLILNQADAQFFRLRKRISEEDVERKVGIARIKMEAKPPKGTSIADIANFPEFFGAKTTQITYRKQSWIGKFPPTTGDSLREVTSDSLAVYLRQNVYDWESSGEVKETINRKRNSIPNLPNEDYQKYLADTVLDEAIDVTCTWYFTENKAELLFKPDVFLKISFFDKKGACRPSLETTLLSSEIKCEHFNESYGTAYDFRKGISQRDISEGGIAGNVVTDVYLQALKKLLAKK